MNKRSHIIVSLLVALALPSLNMSAFAQEIHLTMEHHDTTIVPGEYPLSEAGSAANIADSGWVPTSIAGDIRALITLPNGTIVAGGDSGRIFLSTDNGANFNVANVETKYPVTSFASDSGAVFAGTGGGVFRSSNAGVSWDSIGAIPKSVHCLLAASDGYLYAGTTEAPYIYRIRITDNNEEWSAFNNGFTDASVYALVLAKDGSIIAGSPTAGGSGLHRLAQGNSTWAPIGNLPKDGSNLVYCLAAGSDGALYAGTFIGVMRSADNGASWSPVREVPPTKVLNISTVERNVFVSSSNIFRTQDGNAWNEFDSRNLGFKPSALAFSADLKWGFAGTPRGIYRYGFPLIPWPFVRPYRLYADFPTSPGVFGFSILLGNKGRATDTVSVTTLKNTNQAELKLAQVSGRPVPVGSREVKLHYTLTLTRESVPGVDTIWAQVTTKGLKPESPFIFMVVVTKLPRTAVGGLSEMPTEYALEQNYPNPFNPSTKISFALPRAGDVKVVIFNALGQQERTLVDGNLAAGQHEVQWDGKDDTGAQLPSGIYMIRMTAGTFTSTRNALMLK